MFDINAENRRPYRDALLRSNQNSGIGGKLLVSSDARELYPEVDSSGNLCVFLHLGRNKPDVVCIGNDADTATTLKCYVKFARKIIKIQIVEDIVVQRFCIWLRIDHLGSLESSVRGSSNVLVVMNILSS